MQTCKRGNIKLPKFTNQEEFLATLVSGVILCRLVNTLITPQELKPPLEPNEPRHQFAAVCGVVEYFSSYFVEEVNFKKKIHSRLTIGCFVMSLYISWKTLPILPGKLVIN